MNPESNIRTTPCPTCRICQAPGLSLYQGLRDRLFNVPGEWDLKRCRNPRCGLIWLDPMPMTKDLSQMYENYYTHDTCEYDSLAKRLYRRAIDTYLSRRYGYQTSTTRNVADRLLGFLLYLHPGARAEADARVMSLPAKPGGRLLEVGFGSAQTLRRMRTLGWAVQGVEFDPIAVRNAASFGLDVYQGDLSAQKFAEASFDSVVSSHVIEHLPDPEGFLRECWRILKPGGIFLAYTPNSGSYGHCIFKRDWRGLEPPRHLHIFNSTNLVTMGLNAGLASITCRTTVRGGPVLAASWNLSRSNYRQSMVVRKTSRLIEELAHYFSWIACKCNGDLGEELALIARKPNTPA